MSFDPAQRHPALRQRALRRRQIYGLLVVAVILLLAGAGRSSWPILFPPGWWRVW